jgi:methyl-accepting chemotaxis protein
MPPFAVFRTGGLSVLRTWSVRAILTIVFVALAVGLCASLGWQFYDAWRVSATAQRASTLARADKAMFQATYDVRQQRSDLQSLVQTADDFAAAVANAQKKAQAAFDAGIRAVEATPGIDKTLLAAVRERWPAQVARTRELEELARTSKKPRDSHLITPWYNAMTDVINAQAQLSFYLSNTVRMIDPEVAEYVEARQLAWATRDTAGHECGVARPFLATSKPFSPDVRETIAGLRASSDATLGQLVNLVDRRGVAPQLSNIVTKVRDIVANGKVNRDAAYAKLDGSGKTLVTGDGWTAICAQPLEAIYQIAWLSFDLMLAHVDAIETTARWRLRAIAAELGLSVAFCAGGLLLIRRRVAAPVAELTRTIERLAKREYDAPVAQSRNRDEFGLMSERLESLRMGGIEAERLAADQIAGKDADVRRGATIREECRRFETAISRMLDAVDAAGTQMTTMANTMAATAQQTAGQSTAAAAASEVASSNVNNVAAAAEEMARSISEIGRQVGDAAKAASNAVQRAKGTSASIERLSEAAQKIGEVVDMINAIAGQTNLLALNATIEAARAGEAGKGFAVVATEVKSLAGQTAKATEDVTSQIKAIQQLTFEAVAAIRDIGEVIGRIDGINATIAAAIEEQDATTHSIAGNVQDAANGTAEVSRNIAGVSQVAERSGQTAAEVLSAARAVSTQAGEVRACVEAFVRQIQAA